ncbi:hypothetical protein NDU88_006665 [Pleurodeles waltl]|uniref:Uncharacterized protein n=1 Tax=Pleurodeles waltl TaxID=8319 RepID=A0AAV7WY78_PLEWA|nr:hypothetical protein NDU88_006665 [Pleurodeles waltl]
MPGGRMSGKQSGKPSRQLLFLEALQHSRALSPASEVHPLNPPSTMADPAQGATMDRILQEISAVGRRLEGMDNAMTSLTAETKSMRLDIASFQVPRLGPKRRDNANRPRPIIACLLRHVQTCQLLQAARAHSPFQMDGLEIRQTADFSKETSKCRRAFLALWPHLRQLEVKYGLFKPARMLITKNGVSEDLYDPEDLQVFLEGLQIQTQPMDTEPLTWTQDLPGTAQGDTPTTPTLGEVGWTT